MWEKIYTIKNLITYTIIFLLPVNLAKHYIYKDSYVGTLLVDYLIPTIYVQDILIICLLLVSLIILLHEKRLKNVFSFFNTTYVKLLLVLFVVGLLSSIQSVFPLVSWVFYFRFVLYAFFSLYIIHFLNVNTFKNIMFLLFVSSFLICTLGISQFVLQRSVFNNYLFFGEQPYTPLSYNISKEYILSFKIIPPYSLFRHPNVFGGYLSILLIWFIFFKSILVKKFSRNFYYFVLFMLFICILITFSISAYLSVFVGCLFLGLLFSQKIGYIKLSKISFILIFILFITSLLLPFFLNNSSFLTTIPSFYRRADLISTTYSKYPDDYLFGLGPSASTKVSVVNLLDSFKQPQPVHNVFLLYFVEFGFFYTFIYLLLVIYTFIVTFQNKSIFIITLFQFVTLSLFDHYLLTQHQTYLLFWLTLGFIYKYNEYHVIKD